MTDLQSSSEYRDRGLMSPGMRRPHLRRIVTELRTKEDAADGLPNVPASAEIDAAQDLCFRLYSAEVADLMAERLGSDRQRVREALGADFDAVGGEGAGRGVRKQP